MKTFTPCPSRLPALTSFSAARGGDTTGDLGELVVRIARAHEQAGLACLESIKSVRRELLSVAAMIDGVTLQAQLLTLAAAVETGPANKAGGPGAAESLRRLVSRLERAGDAVNRLGDMALASSASGREFSVRVAAGLRELEKKVPVAGSDQRGAPAGRPASSLGDILPFELTGSK